MLWKMVQRWLLVVTVVAIALPGLHCSTCTDSDCPNGGSSADGTSSSSLMYKQQAQETVAGTETPVLTNLLGTLSRERFFDAYLTNPKMIHIPASKRSPIQRQSTSVLTSDHLLRIVDSHSLRYEDDFKLVINGQTAYTNSEPPKLRDILKNFLDGATAVFNKVQRWVTPLFDMVQQLEQEFGVFVGANVYLSPPNQRGFSSHADTQSVLVLQLEGTKTWTIHEPSNDFLFFHHINDTQYMFDDEELVPLTKHTVTLNAGDVLFLPRGFIHCAETAESHSLHVTFGLHDTQNTWLAMVDSAFKALVYENEVKQPILSQIQAVIDRVIPLPPPLRFPFPSYLLDMDTELSVDAVTAVRPQWKTAINTLKTLCSAPTTSQQQVGQDTMNKTSLSPCGVSSSAWDSLLSTRGFVYGLSFVQQMKCGGTLSSFPDMGSIGFLMKQLKPTMRIQRRPTVTACVLQSAVTGSEVRPILVGVNGKWQSVTHELVSFLGILTQHGTEPFSVSEVDASLHPTVAAMTGLGLVTLSNANQPNDVVLP
eukprot:m.23799 g.23799  ORF g.23799 m.23799 type:complete len:537 (+) comp8530_c1_seq1:95-1705(+)